MKNPTWLLDCKRKKYSQTGEEGIIEAILDIIPSADGWCVEYGAGDGIAASNTRNLIESRGYSAIMIESNSEQFGKLKNNYSGRNNITTINASVGFGRNDNLDCILINTPIPHDFDLLSIDIDGNDYHTWKAMTIYKPKVVVVEFNPTIPTNIQFVQPANVSVNQGTSLLSLVELGKEKGYELVSVLSYNAFFVRAEYYQLFDIENNSPEVMRTDLTYITQMFMGYDGTIFIHGNCHLTWHDIWLNESDFQVLPADLRTYPPAYSPSQMAKFAEFKGARKS